ncbi:MAG: phasin family protein [Alphaproteobacteria bacterium]|nr:phasin family protein [Alphaproteobacteria bacterium]
MAARKTTAGKKPSRATGANADKVTQRAEPVIAEPAVAQEAAPQAEAPAEPVAETKAEPVVETKPEPKKTAPQKSAVKKPEPVSAPAMSAAMSYPDLAALGRENLVAVARANAALVKGFEELGQEVAGYAQYNLVSAIDAARALVGVTTISDLVALNRKVAQATLEGALANSARLSEIGIRVATEALFPLNERVAQTFSRLGRPAG